jgi:hypothetical protein
MNAASPTREDCIRMAALIDCEGCIAIRLVRRHGRQKNDNFQLELSVANTDPRLTGWCARAFGGKSRITKTGSKYPNAKPLWNWRVYGRKAEAVIKYCFDFFLIKKEQAEIALEFQSTIGIAPRRRRVPDEVMRQRGELVDRIHLLKKPHGACDVPWDVNDSPSVEAEIKKTRDTA